MVNAIRATIKEILPLLQHENLNKYSQLDDAMDTHKSQHRWAVVRELYNLAVDTSGLNETKRFFIGTICAYWFDNNLITKQDYVRALSEIISNLEDIAIDVPKIYEWLSPMICELLLLFSLYSFQKCSNFYFSLRFTAAPVFENIMTINDLKDTAEESRSKVLGSLLTYLGYAYGPQYVRNLWKRSKCKFSDFVPNDEVEKFVEKYVSVIYQHSLFSFPYPNNNINNNRFSVVVSPSIPSKQKLKFVENSKETLAPVTTPIADDHLRNRIRELIRRNDFSDGEEVVDYIKVSALVL